MSGTDTLLRSRVVETRPVEWRNFKFIQQDSFKEFSAIDQTRLMQSILSNQFLQPFYAWEHDGNIYCLDGKHRTLTLELMISKGHNVPDLLPATFLDLGSMEEAAKAVLLFSSHYAKITQQGLDDFMQIYALDIEQLFDEISLPAMDIIKPEVMPLPDDLIGELKTKPATIKLTFETPADAEKAIPMIDKLLKENFNNAFFSVSAGEI